MFLVPADSNFPIGFYIPDQIIVRNWYLLHLSVLKSNYLKEGEVFGIDSIDVDRELF